MSNPTATQTALLEMAGVTTSDALWTLLKDGEKGTALARVNSQIQTAFWNLETAETRLNEWLARMIATATDVKAALAAGNHTTTTWTEQAAKEVSEANAEMQKEITAFRQALVIRNLLVAEQA